MTSKKYKNIILATGVMAIIGVSNYLIVKTKNDAPENTLKTTKTHSANISNNLPKSNVDFSKLSDPNKYVQTIEQRIARVAVRQDLSAFNAEEISDAVNDPQIWNTTDAQALTELPLDDIEKADGRSFFKANPARVAVSIPGDTLEVYLPDSDFPMELNVEQVKAAGNGVVSLSGTIGASNEGVNGTFNMTQGNNIIAGHINTNTNTYSFEIFGNAGWIHESGALFTEELPPVHIDDEPVQAPHLGRSGEHIIADSSGTSENKTISNNEDTKTNAATMVE